MDSVGIYWEWNSCFNVYNTEETNNYWKVRVKNQCKATLYLLRIIKYKVKNSREYQYLGVTFDCTDSLLKAYHRIIKWQLDLNFGSGLGMNWMEKKYESTERINGGIFNILPKLIIGKIVQYWSLVLEKKGIPTLMLNSR